MPTSDTVLSHYGIHLYTQWWHLLTSHVNFPLLKDFLYKYLYFSRVSFFGKKIKIKVNHQIQNCDQPRKKSPSVTTYDTVSHCFMSSNEKDSHIIHK